MTHTLSRRSLLAAAAVSLLPRTAAAETLPMITDDAGHEMPYAWRPATSPRRAKTLVWLHGHGTQVQPASVSNPAWNILLPIDRFGPADQGSWWLGEDGDLFTMRLLHALIAQQRQAIGGDKGLYFAGGSMGGYGSLLHGMLLGAKGVYAYSFQSKLRGTDFTDALAPMIEPIGLPATSPYNDLTRYVRHKTRLPVFNLDFSRDDHAEQRYHEQHFLPFVAACEKRGAAYQATVYPNATHGRQRSFSSILRLFG